MNTVDWKSIDNWLGLGSYDFVFAELDRVEMYFDRHRTSYNKLRNEYQDGHGDITFSGRLRLLLSSSELRAKFPQGETTIGKTSPTTVEKPQEAAGKMKILLLTANPAGTGKLNLEGEYAKMSKQLEDVRDKVDLSSLFSVNADDLMEKMLDEKPTILHFSGHGEADGILLQNDDKNGYEFVSGAQLATLFKFFKSQFPLRAVLLNACYSQAQAEAINQHIKYVIGTTSAVKDTHAIAFSTGFYMFLAREPQNIAEAYEAGKARAVLKGASEDMFVLLENPTL